MSDVGFKPTGSPAGASTDDLGFVPSDAPATPAPQGGNMLKNIGVGALNLVENNPISHALTSLSAMPMQGVAKVASALPNPLTGGKSLQLADPYAGGIGAGTGLPAINMTSSDQPLSTYAEEQAGNAATVGSLFLPAARIAGAATPYLSALGRFAPAAARIGTQAAIGGFQGLAGGMQAGQDASGLRGSARTGAIFGGGLATAGELGSALLDSVANTTGTSRLTDHVQGGGAAKTLTKAFNEASTPTTNPISTMEQNGLIKDLRVTGSTVNIENLTNPARTGSLDSLIQDQQEMGTQAIRSMGNAGGTTVNPEDAGVALATFKQQVIDSIKSNPALKASGNVGKITAEIGRRFDDYAESYGETLNFDDLNSIRIAMNKVWDPETWDAEKAIGNAARGILYNAPSGGTALKSAMQNEQELINTKEFLQKVAGTKVSGGRLTKIIADSTAAAVGAGMGLPIPFVGPAVGAGVSAYATNKVMNAMQENYFNPIMGGAARSLQPFAPALSTAKTVGQAAAIPAIVQK